MVTDWSSLVQPLLKNGHYVLLRGFDAIDRYREWHGLGSSESQVAVTFITNADVLQIIQAGVGNDHEFPGEHRIDALCPDTEHPSRSLIFRTIDHDDAMTDRCDDIWRQLMFSYDLERHCYQLPPLSAQTDEAQEALYRVFREGGELHRDDLLLSGPRLVKFWWYVVSDAALMAARFGWEAPWLSELGRELVHKEEMKSSDRLGALEQQVLLSRLLESDDPAKGLRILMDVGFIAEHWPVVQSMRGVSQNKDFHPEGDVWEHTLEMFRYVKRRDMGLSLAVLLHDCGKAFARKVEGNEFDQHAQIGSGKAASFLKALEFPERIVLDVMFLVREHMLPGQVTRLPVYRTERVLDHPSFPRLLELFRCDISSSFVSPDPYYEACEWYRRYQRHKRNPYRKSDGTLQTGS